MITPSDFLDLAEELNNDDRAQESKHRTSISRAYYAAFHEAVKQYAKYKNMDIKDRIFENHQYFIRELRLDQSKELIRTIGNQLHSLKKDRFKADYELNQNITLSAAVKSFHTSKRIITNCSKL